MYRKPSGRRRKAEPTKLNLIPILDSVFIFIFFLLMSANFVQLFEISSDVPIISQSAPPPSKQKPLALTVKIFRNSIQVLAGVPSRRVKTIKKNELGKYKLQELHSYLIGVKKNNLFEDTVIFVPKIDIAYEELVQIMDSVRMLHNTDEALYRKDKEGLQEKVKVLFNQIVFGNLTS